MAVRLWTAVSKKVAPLTWLLDWANDDRNFSIPSECQITRQLLADDTLVCRVAALYKTLALQTSPEHAQNAIKGMLSDCVVISNIVAVKHKPDASLSRPTPPTRTELSRELLVLAGDIKSVQEKVGRLTSTLGTAVSVAYLCLNNCVDCQ